MSWYFKVLKNYVGFSGRARRKEYWMFSLVNWIVWAVLLIFEFSTGLTSESLGYYGPLTLMYGLALTLPQLAVTVRRLHDVGRTGWWIFIGLIPFIGAIVLIVFLATDGNRGDNKYGPDPKQAVAPAATVQGGV